MQKLSAVEAVAPAWNHTREFLVTPRSWRLVLKVGLMGLLAQLGGLNLNLTNPSKFGSGLPPEAAAAMAVGFLILAIIGLAVSIVLMYLGSRLQFVFFEMVLRRDTKVGPMWNRYGPVTWRWFGLKLLYLLIAGICLAPFLVLPVMRVLHVLQADGGLNTPSFQQVLSFIPLFLPLLGAFFLVVAGYVLLYQFGLPFIALEGLSMGATCRRVGSLLAAEPLAFAGYLLMLFALGLGLGIATALVFLLGLLVLAIPFGAVGAMLWFGLHHAGLLGNVAMGLGFGIEGLLALALVVALLLAIYAWTLTFYQAYALYFLGGRYPQLGDRLDGHNPPPERVTVSPLYPNPYPPPSSYSV